MGRHSRVSDAQCVELWQRYRSGATVLGIAEALGQRSTSNVYRVLEASGGITPAHRHRAPRVLSFAEREEISRGVAAGETLRTIAKRLDRAISTVSQELARHGGRRALPSL
jgi:DNA-binding NarL/FixJ family response regulator